MPQLVTIIGGSGFVGRNIARRMAQAGWRVRVATRRPNEAMFVKPYGTVGQVEPVFCNIRNDQSVRAVIAGADAVVNCVGILAEQGLNSFDAIQKEGAERVARIAKEQGVGKLVHLSAIGADPEGESAYAKSKGLGEAGITQHFKGAVILRPSVIFGDEDQLFNKFAGMAQLTPVLPLVGADTQFQPVHVDDVAKAAEHAITGDAKGGVYEIGGPEVMSLRDIVNTVLDVIQRRRLVLNLPFWMGSILAGILDILQAVTIGLFRNTILTRDQVKSLKSDAVVSKGAKTLADLGVTPVAAETILPDYLWPYRPSGQYADIKKSAKNLKA